MNLGKLLSKLGEGFSVPNASEREKLVKLVALAVYWDEQITDKEREVANSVLREHCREMKFTDNEIKYTKIEFEEKLKDYKKNHASFVKDKRAFKEFCRVNDSEKYILIVKKIFASDGLDESEKRALKNLES